MLAPARSSDGQPRISIAFIDAIDLISVTSPNIFLVSLGSTTD